MPFSHLLLFADTTLKEIKYRLKYALGNTSSPWDSPLQYRGKKPYSVSTLLKGFSCSEMCGGISEHCGGPSSHTAEFQGKHALGEEYTILRVCKWSGSNLPLYNKKSSIVPRDIYEQQFCCAARVWPINKWDFKSLIKVGKLKEKKQ